MSEGSKFDIIGDVHGCFEHLLLLIAALKQEDPSDRLLVFVGDLVDRGPKNRETFYFVKSLVDSGKAVMVQGNHDNKFARWLKGNKVKVSHGLEKTISEFQDLTEDEKIELSNWILSQPTQITLTPNLIVTHGAPGTRERNLYGWVGGQAPDGKPVRKDWAIDYQGPFCVYGHVIYATPYITSNAIGIDTGCFESGKLTAYRWPEHKLVQVQISV